jgi:hypothetical protein
MLNSSHFDVFKSQKKIGSAKCHICGRSANLTNYLSLQICGIVELIVELIYRTYSICGPPTFSHGRQYSTSHPSHAVQRPPTLTGLTPLLAPTRQRRTPCWVNSLRSSASMAFPHPSTLHQCVLLRPLPSRVEFVRNICKINISISNIVENSLDIKRKFKCTVYNCTYMHRFIICAEQE